MHENECFSGLLHHFFDWTSFVDSHVVDWFFYGEYLDNHDAKQKVLIELTELFGKQVALQIQSLIENMAISSNSKTGIIVGVATLIFTSTTVFVEIQDSINTIWGVKPKPKKVG